MCPYYNTAKSSCEIDKEHITIGAKTNWCGHHNSWHNCRKYSQVMSGSGSSGKAASSGVGCFVVAIVIFMLIQSCAQSCS